MESIANRNDAYKSIIDKLPERRKYIFQLIQEHPNSTAWDLANLTMLPFNQVAARITELKELCLIEETGSKIDSYTKKKNTTYKTISSLNERIELINKTFVQLRDDKSKLESDYRSGVSNLTKNLVQKRIKGIKNQISSLSKFLEPQKT